MLTWADAGALLAVFVWGVSFPVLKGLMFFRRTSTGSRPSRRAPMSMSRSITKTASGRPAPRYAAFCVLFVT